MAILDDVKLALRVSNNAFDSELTNLIAAAKLDLRGAGVVVIEDTDPLTKQAIITYTKANFGLDNSDSLKMQTTYDTIKRHMAVSKYYNVAPETGV